jgi:ribosomal protein L32
MATPKKKVSKGRRNMRRFASGNKLAKVTYQLDENGNPKRPNTVTLETIAAYVEARQAQKKSRASKSKNA